MYIEMWLPGSAMIVLYADRWPNGCLNAPELYVAWAVSYRGLVECVCSVAMWFLCVNCGMGCGLPVVMRHLTAKPEAT